jgi:hypothetical protein
MDRETISKLRLDRRLIQRRGWISPEDLDREIEALPDVSNKAAADEQVASDATPGPSAKG